MRDETAGHPAAARRRKHQGRPPAITVQMTSHRIIFALIILSVTRCTGQEFRRFELGVQTTTCVDCVVGRWALGPEVAFNINRYLSLDSSVTFSLTRLNDSTGESGGRSTQVLIGPKVTIRGSRFSLFAKGRPGFVRWSHAITGQQLLGTPNFPIEFSFGSRYLFAINVAGGLQYAFNSRVDVQAELGDTVVQNRMGISQYSNNIQATTGIIYKIRALNVVHHDAALRAHKFLDRTNVLLFSAGLLAQSADAVTTQRHLANCRRTNSTPGSDAECEGNPLARPFVTHGWGGQVAISAIASSAEVLLMYGIHRMGYHSIERTVPVAQAIANGTEAYRNLQR
jgi:hypothetical protein